MDSYPERDSRFRRRSARIAGILLLAQGALALTIGLRQGELITWRRQVNELLTAHFWDGLAGSGTFVLIAVLAWVAALGAFFLRRSAWLLAMFVQLLTLVCTLIFYFRGGPDLMDSLMAVAVFLVFYLKSEAVRGALHGDHDEPLSDHG